MMTYQYHICLIWLAIGLSGQWVNGQQVSVIANKYILTSNDSEVNLECHSTGIPENPQNVIQFTVQGNVIFNSANYSQNAPGVTYKLNAEILNKISYNQIQNGLIDVGCSINNVASLLPLTIPYMSDVRYEHEPNKFKIHDSFRSSCSFSLLPNVSNIGLMSVQINYQLNDTLIARFYNRMYQMNN